MLFIDEAGANIAMTRTCARAPEGMRVQGSTPYRWGENVTMIGAMGLEGLRTMLAVEGGTTSEVFLAFVTELLVPVLTPTDIVVMDNLSSHKVPGVQEAIETTGAMVRYLPPYSPDMNPSERCWSKLKEILRSLAARTRDALDDAISYAMRCIDADDAAAWFTHAGYHLQAK